jgi:hypothetical protein
LPAHALRLKGSYKLAKLDYLPVAENCFAINLMLRVNGCSRVFPKQLDVMKAGLHSNSIFSNDLEFIASRGTHSGYYSEALSIISFEDLGLRLDLDNLFLIFSHDQKIRRVAANFSVKDIDNSYRLFSVGNDIWIKLKMINKIALKLIAPYA